MILHWDLLFFSFPCYSVQLQPNRAKYVVAVDKQGYDTWTVSEGSKTYQTGSDKITLVNGQNYFICGFAGQPENSCQRIVTWNQKFLDLSLFLQDAKGKLIKFIYAMLEHEIVLVCEWLLHFYIEFCLTFTAMYVEGKEITRLILDVSR